MHRILPVHKTLPQCHRLHMDAIILVLLFGYISSVQCQGGDCHTFKVPENITMAEQEAKGSEIFNISYCGVQPWSMNVTDPHHLSTGYFTWGRDGNLYVLTLNKTIDLEVIDQKYRMVLYKIDLVFFAPGSQQELSINVLPVNEFKPSFIRTPFATNVLEASPVNSTVFNLTGRYQDTDIRDYITRIETVPTKLQDFDGSTYFHLDNQSIRVTKEFDFEKLLLQHRPFFYLGLIIYDTGNKSATTEIRINVEDRDEPPVFVRSSCQRRTTLYPWMISSCLVSEYTLYVEPGGNVVTLPDVITAIDHDIMNNTIQYFLPEEDIGVFSNESCTLAIDENSGRPSVICNMSGNDTGNYDDFFRIYDGIDLNITIQATEVSEERLNTTIPALIHFGPAPTTSTKSSVSTTTVVNSTRLPDITMTTLPVSTPAVKELGGKRSIEDLLIIIIPSAVGGIILIIIIIIICRSCRGRDEEREYRLQQQKLAKKEEYYAAYDNVGRKGDIEGFDGVAVAETDMVKDKPDFKSSE